MRAAQQKSRQMKKIQKKAHLEKPKPVLIEIDPTENWQGIAVPKIEYRVVAEVGMEEVFTGMVLPIPRALLYFLSHSELMVLSVILEESFRTEGCFLTTKEIAKRIKASAPTVTNTLCSLRQMGILLERGNGQAGSGRIRKVNYKAVQTLNDLVQGEDPGIYSRIRKATRKKDIRLITKDDLQQAYDTHVLPPDHDPAEEEEYD